VRRYQAYAVQVRTERVAPLVSLLSIDGSITDSEVMAYREQPEGDLCDRYRLVEVPYFLPLVGSFAGGGEILP
jgi:hypothetical protein